MSCVSVIRAFPLEVSETAEETAEELIKRIRARMAKCEARFIRLKTERASRFERSDLRSRSDRSG
jgi:hypothetical protein